MNLTKTLRDALRAALEDPLPSEMPVAAQDEATLDFLEQAVVDALLSDEAVEAGKNAIHGGYGCTCRAGAKGDAKAVLEAAIKAVSGEF